MGKNINIIKLTYAILLIPCILLIINIIGISVFADIPTNDVGGTLVENNSNFYVVYGGEHDQIDSKYEKLSAGLYTNDIPPICLYSLPKLQTGNVCYLGKKTDLLIIIQNYVPNDLSYSTIRVFKNGTCTNEYLLSDFFYSVSDLHETTSHYYWIENESYNENYIKIELVNGRRIYINLSDGKVYKSPSYIELLLIVLVITLIISAVLVKKFRKKKLFVVGFTDMED